MWILQLEQWSVSLDMVVQIWSASITWSGVEQLFLCLFHFQKENEGEREREKYMWSCIEDANMYFYMWSSFSGHTIHSWSWCLNWQFMDWVHVAKPDLETTDWCFFAVYKLDNPWLGSDTTFKVATHRALCCYLCCLDTEVIGRSKMENELALSSPHSQTNGTA